MSRLRVLARAGVSAALLLAVQAPAIAHPAAAKPLVIGVDHADPANQQPDKNRVFEYSDFFSRTVTVHSGDVVDFQAAPGSFHIIGLASDANAAIAAYPPGAVDTADPNLAPGSGLPKITVGSGQFSVTGGSVHGGGQVGQSPSGPPVCGVQALGQQPCTFKGGDDVEIAGPNPGVDAKGNPTPADWLIQINAPAGTYDYFCTIHPLMRGKLTVVDASQPATAQADVDAASAAQFQAEQAQALQAEQAANKVVFTGGDPGSRTYQVLVGISGGDYVTIDEMLPSQPLNLVPGDLVQYKWTDPNNVHNVAFPANSPKLPGVAGFNCGTTFNPIPDQGPPTVCVEPASKHPVVIFDPGNAPSGTALTDPTQYVDSGIFIGANYGIKPIAQAWSVVTNGSTALGTYNYQCTVHDWMQGTLKVAATLPSAPGASAGPTTSALQKTQSGNLAGNTGGAYAYYTVASPTGSPITLTLTVSPFDAGQAHAVGLNVYQNGALIGSAKEQATGYGDPTNSSSPSLSVTPSATGGPVTIQVFNYSTDAISYTLSQS